jgi:hypothetical protein
MKNPENDPFGDQADKSNDASDEGGWYGNGGDKRPTVLFLYLSMSTGNQQRKKEGRSQIVELGIFRSQILVFCH